VRSCVKRARRFGSVRSSAAWGRAPAPRSRRRGRGGSGRGDPYVNTVALMIGGRGRDEVRAFYADHFLSQIPPDTEMVPVSRTVGQGRVVDEFVLRFTHTIRMNWILPGVPPTGRRVQADLDERRGLVPVDVLVGDLVPVELHDHDDRELPRPSSRSPDRGSWRRTRRRCAPPRPRATSRRGGEHGPQPAPLCPKVPSPRPYEGPPVHSYRQWTAPLAWRSSGGWSNWAYTLRG
jgi:hypothetical protein